MSKAWPACAPDRCTALSLFSHLVAAEDLLSGVLRILFVSGHCKETVAPEELIANADYLQKPYRSETLLGKIDSLLRAPEQTVETSNSEEAKHLTAA